jgi:hypothetical protein
MVSIVEALKHPDKKEYWQNELESLGIEPRQKNELNDKQELEAWQKSSRQSITKITKRHIVVIKTMTIKHYKSHFDHLI